MKNFKQNGFVLLFAVLLVSIVLTVTLVLLDITLRQLVLSATNRDSQKAYYAAHAGLDCAIFWDRDKNVVDHKPFGSYTNAPQDPEPPGITVQCGDTNDPVDWSENVGSTIGTALIDIVFSDGSCAKLKVTKQAPDEDEETGDTIIQSSGYNLSNASACPDANSNRLVERTLVTTYNDNWK